MAGRLGCSFAVKDCSAKRPVWRPKMKASLEGERTIRRTSTYALVAGFAACAGPEMVPAPSIFPIVVFGRILTADGSPAPGVLVRAMSYRQSCDESVASGSPSPGAVPTDSTGSYEILIQSSVSVVSCIRVVVLRPETREAIAEFSHSERFEIDRGSSKIDSLHLELRLP